MKTRNTINLEPTVELGASDDPNLCHPLVTVVVAALIEFKSEITGKWVKSVVATWQRGKIDGGIAINSKQALTARQLVDARLV